MKKILLGLLSLAILLCSGCFKGEHKEIPPPYTADSGGVEVTVSHVVDGDTLIVRRGLDKVKVRLIGIDTPESVHRDESKNTREGKIASERLARYLTGKTVRLEFDAESQDKYGRWLAYVYYNGSMVNAELLKAGLAKALTIPPNTKHADEFAEIEAAARESGAGFWGAESSLFLNS